MSEEKQPAIVKKFDYYDDLADRLRKNSKDFRLKTAQKLSQANPVIDVKQAVPLSQT